MKTQFAVLSPIILALTGCTDYPNFPPNDKGLLLIPTGWAKKIYHPGQVNFGQEGRTGYANQLVLVQNSGANVREQFIGESGYSPTIR